MFLKKLELPRVFFLLKKSEYDFENYEKMLLVQRNFALRYLHWELFPNIKDKGGEYLILIIFLLEFRMHYNEGTASLCSFVPPLLLALYIELSTSIFKEDMGIRSFVLYEIFLCWTLSFLFSTPSLLQRALL